MALRSKMKIHRRSMNIVFSSVLVRGDRRKLVGSELFPPLSLNFRDWLTMSSDDDLEIGEGEFDAEDWGMGDEGEEVGEEEEVEDGGVEKTREELKAEVVKWEWEAATWRELHDTEEMKTEYLREGLEKVKRECEEEIERARRGCEEEVERVRREGAAEVDKWKRLAVNWQALYKTEKSKADDCEVNVNPMEFYEEEIGEVGGQMKVKLKEVSVRMVNVEVPRGVKKTNNKDHFSAEHDEELGNSEHSEVRFKEKVALKKVDAFVEKKTVKAMDENSNSVKKRKRSSGEGSSWGGLTAEGEGSSGGGGSGRRCDLCGEEFSSLRRHSQVTRHQHTVQLALYFRGLLSYRGHLAKMPSKCPLKP